MTMDYIEYVFQTSIVTIVSSTYMTIAEKYLYLKPKVTLHC